MIRTHFNAYINYVTLKNTVGDNVTPPMNS